MLRLSTLALLACSVPALAQEINVYSHRQPELIQPLVDAFTAETGAAAVLLVTAHIGLPVSTTHTITSTVMGVGAVKRLSAVRWGVTTRILSAWLFTLPGAALLATVFYLLLSQLL